MSKYSELIEKARDFLVTRKQAYQQVFNAESPYAERVLRDLAKFCRANKTTMHPDPRMHAMLEGRREVWLRLQNHLQLDDNQLWEIYDGRKDNIE